MPFFPTSTAGEQNEGFDLGGASYQTYQQSNEPNPQYAYADTQPRTDAPQPGSAYYLEDASMHLKLQSLSILDNLVRQS